MDINEIKNAYLKGKDVPAKHAAKAIAGDAEMLFTYLVDNNSFVINRTLRQDLGFEYLPFVADRKRIGAVISSLIAKKDFEALNTIIKKFEFNKAAGNYTTNAELLNELKPYLKAHV